MMDRRITHISLRNAPTLLAAMVTEGFGGMCVYTRGAETRGHG